MSENITKIKAKEKSERKIIADKIIHRHVIWAISAGSIPFPVVDVLGVSAIQLDMLHQLCNLYEIDYDANRGKNLLTAFAGGSIARIGSGLLKFVPIFGSALGMFSMAAFSGASTYAIANVFISNFEDGVGLFEINIEKGEKLFQDAYERGKEYVESLKTDK